MDTFNIGVVCITIIIVVAVVSATIATIPPEYTLKVETDPEVVALFDRMATLQEELGETCVVTVMEDTTVSYTDRPADGSVVTTRTEGPCEWTSRMEGQ